ncbi:MAG: DUF4238 domain-containing protein [Rhodospirillales bacterium]|nr:DUF4238 domain-containing protein [Rhodospirillales bacterium]MBI2584739.1 DUF4238 domain-containing protein [Rhodospirillales bacterium]
MALDHYVSQVHLRNFYSSDMGGKKMYAIRKRDLKQFPCGSEDVCRIEKGNTNDYLLESRAIEKFLEIIEPRYNESVEKFRSGKIDNDSIFVVSGFIAYILSCSPAAMRIGADPLRHMVEKTAAILDAGGKFPPPPKELGGNSLRQLLDEQKIFFEIDEKYPQALAISGIYHRTIAFGNFDWDILINEELGSPFFTSDFPVAIEQSDDLRIINRIAPLAPDIAIRIRPSLAEERRDSDFHFKYFSHRRHLLSHGEVRYINKQIVRCAEELVFFRDNQEWVFPFVRRNTGFRIEPITTRIPVDNGEFQWTTMRIVQRDE